MWGATRKMLTKTAKLQFQLTHPMWGATKDSIFDGQHSGFQLTHPMWGATVILILLLLIYQFQLTHPMWGATRAERGGQRGVHEFQLTHPMWGATGATFLYSSPPRISTHTPHVGCDLFINFSDCSRYISTHTPHVGCDPRFCEKNKNRTLYVGVDIRNTAF